MDAKLLEWGLRRNGSGLRGFLPEQPETTLYMIVDSGPGFALTGCFMPDDEECDLVFQHVEPAKDIAEHYLRRWLEFLPQLAWKRFDSPIARIWRERQRQIEAEGWTPEHDVAHRRGELARAAGCYAHHAAGVGTSFGEPWPLDPTQKMKLRNGCMLFWPWADEWWKPSTPDRDLEKAGALIVAEMERRDAERHRENGGVA